MMYDDEDDLEGSARSYKDDGNVEYNKGTKEGYLKAIISYTGLLNMSTLFVLKWSPSTCDSQWLFVPQCTDKAVSISEGINKKCDNTELNSQLYCNRAAAQFLIGNYRFVAVQLRGYVIVIGLGRFRNNYLISWLKPNT